MVNGRGKAGSGGDIWVAVGFGLFRGGFGDAINLAQPATQIDGPTAAGTKGEVRPFHRLAPNFPVAYRAACFLHRPFSAPNLRPRRISSAGYFFPLADFAGVDGFAG